MHEKKVPVHKKCQLKTVALAVKQDKLSTENSGKNKQQKVARVELRTGGDLDRSHKSWCSASGIGKLPRNKKHPVRENSNNQHQKNVLEILATIQSRQFYWHREH